MTTQINLLPWREQQREEQKKQFFVILLSAILLAAVIVAIVYMMVSTDVKHERQANNYIENETSVLDQRLAEIQEVKEQKQELIARRQVLQSLQIERVAVINLLQNITEKLPEGIYLTQIQKEGETLTLTGKAESNTRVSELMKKIEASPWVKDPLLTEIKSDDKDNVHVRDFSIRMSVYLPPVTALQREKQSGT